MNGGGEKAFAFALEDTPGWARVFGSEFPTPRAPLGALSGTPGGCGVEASPIGRGQSALPIGSGIICPDPADAKGASLLVPESVPPAVPMISERAFETPSPDVLSGSAVAAAAMVVHLWLVAIASASV